MCGIAGIHVFNQEKTPGYIKLENAIDQLLAAIDNRGGDATGIVAIGGENTTWQKASCGATDFYKERRPIPYNSQSILLHTRMATQGSAAFPENNHPVRRGSVYIVHNGHIWNDHEIFRRTNRERYGQVDSEAIAALIAKYGIMNTHKAMEEIRGAAAIGVVDDTRPGLMALARGSSSPLMFYRNEDVAVFASTKDAVKRAWKVLYGTPPRDKNIEDVKEGIALYLDKSVDRVKFTPDDYISYYSGGKRWWEKDDKKYTDHKSYSYDNVKILCGHGCWTKECEICNPDDKEGSYLSDEDAIYEKLIERGKKNNEVDWLLAKQCELCGKYYPEDMMTNVQDWDEDQWVFCNDCCEEMSDVISDCDLTAPPVKIYGMTEDEWLSSQDR